MARGPSAVQVRGLREFQAGLRAADTKLPRAMTAANRKIAERVASSIQDEARSRGGLLAKAAPAVVGRGEQRAAKIAINKGTQFRFADGAFFGAKQYQQFDPWVGNQHEMTWPVGANDEGPGRGPYALNPGIFAAIDDIERFYLDEFEDAVAAAFPSELASLGSTFLGR